MTPSGSAAQFPPYIARLLWRCVLPGWNAFVDNGLAVAMCPSTHRDDELILFLRPEHPNFQEHLLLNDESHGAHKLSHKAFCDLIVFYQLGAKQKPKVFLVELKNSDAKIQPKKGQKDDAAKNKFRGIMDEAILQIENAAKCILVSLPEDCEHEKITAIVAMAESVPLGDAVGEYKERLEARGVELHVKSSADERPTNLRHYLPRHLKVAAGDKQGA